MTLAIWRHPQPQGVTGRCIGRTDVPVDPRKAKRLAHRVRQWARRHGAPHVVITSPLQRGAQVGRWLAAWGWCHRIDARLSELDFGDWDGLLWQDIAAAVIDAWCADFAAHAPGGGETVDALLTRCAAFLAAHGSDDVTSHSEPAARPSLCVIGHAGWISAALTLARPDAVIDAAHWPASVRYMQQVLVGCDGLATGAPRVI